MNLDRALTLTSRQPVDLKPIEDALNVEQMRTFELALEIGLQLGEIRGTLHAEKLSLEQTKITVESEIKQLKSLHCIELQVLSDDQFSIRQVINERIKSFVAELEVFRNQKAETKIFSQDMTLLISLSELVQETKESLIYPSYPLAPEGEQLCEEKKENALVVPVTGNTLVAFQNQVKALKQSVLPLRRMIRTWVERKKEMIEFHQKLLEEQRQREKPLIKAILDKVRSVQQSVNWATLAGPSVNYFNTLSYSPPSRRFLMDDYQREITVEVKKIQDRLNGVIKTIERYT